MRSREINSRGTIFSITRQGKMASTLMTWERKVLRKIYGSKCEEGMWRIRSNLELQNARKLPDTVNEIMF
jgi:hypothetical protein